MIYMFVHVYMYIYIYMYNETQRLSVSALHAYVSLDVLRIYVHAQYDTNVSMSSAFLAQYAYCTVANYFH